MKYLALAAALTVFAVPALAQKQECTDENKTKWYQSFLDNRKGNEAQKVAYERLRCTWTTARPIQTMHKPST
jgi:hypothetical protein